MLALRCRLMVPGLSGRFCRFAPLATRRPLACCLVAVPRRGPIKTHQSCRLKCTPAGLARSRPPTRTLGPHPRCRSGVLKSSSAFESSTWSGDGGGKTPGCVCGSWSGGPSRRPATCRVHCNAEPPPSTLPKPSRLIPWMCCFESWAVGWKVAAIMSATPSQQETGVFKQQLVDTAASTCSLSVPRMMQTVPSTE